MNTPKTTKYKQMFDVTFAHKNKRKVLKVKASVAVTKLLLPCVQNFH